MEEEHLERDQNECDALDTVGVSPGMSVEVVPVVVNIKTLKKRLTDCTQVRDQLECGRGEKCRNEEESCRSVCSQV